MDTQQGTMVRGSRDVVRLLRERVQQAHSIEEALQAFYDSMFEAFPIDEGGVYIFEKSNTSLRALCSTEGFKTTVVPLAGLLELLSKFQIVSLQTTPLKAYRDLLRTSGCTSGIIIPIGTDATILGFLFLGRTTMHPFTENELHLCDVIIEVGSIILQPFISAIPHLEDKGLLEDVPVGFYILQDETLVYINDYTAKLFGYTIQDIMAMKSPYVGVTDEENVRIHIMIDECLQDKKKSFDYTFTGIHKNGKRLDIETRGGKTYFHGRPAIQGTLIDISERKSIERELLRRNRELNVLNILSNEMSSARSLDEVYTLLDRVLKETMNIDRVVLRLVDRYPRESYSSLFDCGAMNEELFADGTLSAETLLCRDVVSNRAPILIDNCRQSVEIDFEKAARLNLRSTLALPVISKERILGMLRIDDSRHTVRFHQEDIKFLTMVCRHAAKAIENVLWYQTEKVRSIRLESIRTLTREWMNIFDSHELMNKAVRMIGESFGYDSTAIFLIRSASQTIHYQVGYGKNFRTPQENITLKMNEGLIGTCAQRNSVVLVNDVRLDERWVAGRLTETRSELCIPLRTHNGVIGILDIQQTVTDAFTDEDALFLQIIADELTAVFENDLLFDEIRYQANVLTNINDAIISADANWNIRAWNYGAERLYGWKSSEVIGKNMYHLIHNEYIGATPDDVLSAMIYHGGWRGEIRQYTKEGKVVYVSAVASTLRASDGSISGFVNVNRDISEKRKLIGSLHETEGLLSSVIEQTPFGIGVFREEGTMIRVNQAFLRMFGITNREEYENKYNILKDEGFIKKLGLMPKIEKAFGGENISIGPIEIQPDILPVPMNARQGSISLEIRLFSVFDDSNNIRQVVALYEDVSEQVSLQQQLVQSQKMEAVGTLAGGIAHDFNNLLGGILGYASFAKTKVEAGSPLIGYLDTIERSAQRASELTGQLLGFARRGKYATAAIDCNEIIRDTVKLLERSLDKRITIQLALSDATPTIQADAGQFEQALLNLCVNARDAMPAGGTLTIRSSLVDVTDDYVRSHLGSEAKQYVRIDVEDTGIGMDEETRNRIFEPFFTTKEKGKGTGLGLSMVYGIVRNHEGFVNVYSEPNRGSIFHLYFPYIGAELKKEIPSSASLDVEGGSEVILLVDDEEVIRDFTREVLEAHGYSVLTATDGDDALRIFKGLHAQINAVVLDMIMPLKGGLETYREMKKIAPDVKVLLSSGYSRDGQAQEILDEGVMGFVQKPYDVTHLFAALRKVLDS